MFGTSITIRPTDRETALRPHPPYSVLRNAMVRSPFRIPAAALQGHIRYRFAYRDGHRLRAAADRRAARDRRPARRGRRRHLRRPAAPACPSDEAARADALRPTAWLQSDHPRIRAIAAPFARHAVSDARKMERLRGADAPLCPGSTSPAISRRSRRWRAAPATAPRRRCCSPRWAGRRGSRPGWSAASSIRASAITASAMSSCRTAGCWPMSTANGSSFDLGARAVRRTHIAITVGDGDARSIAAANQLASLLAMAGHDRGQGPSGHLTRSSRRPTCPACPHRRRAVRERWCRPVARPAVGARGSRIAPITRSSAGGFRSGPRRGRPESPGTLLRGRGRRQRRGGQSAPPSPTGSCEFLPWPFSFRSGNDNRFSEQNQSNSGGRGERIFSAPGQRAGRRAPAGASS